MENENFIEKLATKFGQSASVKNVFGEPIQAGNKTIIPVAQIGYGLGGGYVKPKEQDEDSKEREDTLKYGSFGESAGGGGGLMAKPKGVYEITPKGTRFIPANNLKQSLIYLTAGFLICKIFFSKHKNNRM